MADIADTIAIADPERALALAYARAGDRAGLAALWAFDERLGDLVRTTREPMIGAIRLAWWREAIQRLTDQGVTDEPLLAALRDALVARGIGMAELIALVDGWEILLGELPLDEVALADFAHQRGETLWKVGAGLLGQPCPADLARAGGGWALADLAYHIRDTATAQRAIRMAQGRLDTRSRWPGALRPLGMLVMLARRDVGTGMIVPRAIGSPTRMMRMAWHRITGR